MTEHKLTKDNARQFILAGKAIFTIRSLKTQERYTYRVTKADNGKLWFVSLLTGPENNSNYTYLGVIKGEYDLKFTLTLKSSMSWTSVPVVAFRWTFAQLEAGKLSDQVEIWHAGKCGRCGRTLTVPESIEQGFGPECINLVGGKQSKQVWVNNHQTDEDGITESHPLLVNVAGYPD